MKHQLKLNRCVLLARLLVFAMFWPVSAQADDGYTSYYYSATRQFTGYPDRQAKFLGNLILERNIPQIYYLEIPRFGVPLTSAPSYTFSWGFLDVRIQRRLQAASTTLKMFGVNVIYTSGWRPSWYNSTLKSGPNVVYSSSPKSSHILKPSQAADIGFTPQDFYSTSLVVNTLYNHGLYYPLPYNDPVHVKILLNEENYDVDHAIFALNLSIELKSENHKLEKTWEKLDRANRDFQSNYEKATDSRIREFDYQVHERIEEESDRAQYWHWNED